MIKGTVAYHLRPILIPTPIRPSLHLSRSTDAFRAAGLKNADEQFRSLSTPVKAPALSPSHSAEDLRPTLAANGRFQQSRQIQIQSTPSTPDLPVTPPSASTQSVPDAAFEVLASPSSSPSLLSIALQPSHPIFTRRGSLVAIHGASPDHTVSTLAPLSPVLRAPLGIPFLYQQITSASPLRLLLAARGSATSFCVLSIDGTQDWVVSQRNALTAWTGRSLNATPNITTTFGLANFGQTTLTGRGLVALAAKGGSYSVQLQQGEQFIAAPGHVLAYSVGRNQPQPYRLASTTLRLTVPDLTGWLPDIRFVRELRKSSTWKFLAGAAFRLRTWSRRTIWGDRLLVRFTGPGTVLLQGRGASVADVLTDRQVDEIMDSRSGSVLQGMETAQKKAAAQEAQKLADEAAATRKAPTVKTASVGKDGKLTRVEPLNTGGENGQRGIQLPLSQGPPSFEPADVKADAHPLAPGGKGSDGVEAYPGGIVHHVERFKLHAPFVGLQLAWKGLIAAAYFKDLVEDTLHEVVEIVSGVEKMVGRILTGQRRR